MQQAAHQTGAGHGVHRLPLYRKLEWLGCAVALFMLSGAVFPLLMVAPDNLLDEAERSQLRRMIMPVYVLTLIFLMRHPKQVFLAAARNVPMLALLSLPFLSVLWSIAPSFTMRRAVALMMSVMLALLLAIRFTPRQQALLFAAVLGALTVASLVMAVANPTLAYKPGETALRGIFVHKNVLGWVASIAVLMGISLTQDGLRGVRRAGWSLTGIGVAGLLLSESVTSLTMAGVAVLLFFAYRALERRKGLARMVLQLVFLQIAALLLILLVMYLVPTLEYLGKDATLTGRVPLWQLVDPEIAKRPMLGYGYGAFWSDNSLVALRIWELAGWQAPHAHSGYRDLLLGFGLAGAVVFAVLICTAMQRGLALQYAAPRDGWLWCNLMIGSSLVMNLSESTILMQNDLIWILTSTAILTVSFRYRSLKRQLPRAQRLAVTAA